MKAKKLKIEELLEAGVHFGHQVKRWNPKMEQYIYTVSNKIHIIDLEKTSELLEKAADFLYETAKEGGQIIFVGTKKQARDSVETAAKESGAMYVNERWIGGTVTNFSVIRRTLDKFLKMIKDKEEGKFLTTHTKKERLLIDRQIEKFQKFYGGIASMKGTPAALFIIDQKRENTAIREAVSAGIPVVGLIDTNADPTNIDYVIPGNDDAIRSISLVVRILAEAVAEGNKEYEKKLKEGKLKKESAEAAEAAETAEDSNKAVEKKETSDKEVDSEKKKTTKEAKEGKEKATKKPTPKKK